MTDGGRRLGGLAAAVLFGAFTTGASGGDGLKKGETICVSMAGDAPANGPSFRPAISEHGRFIAFVTAATDLTTPAGNGKRQIVVHDRKKGSTRIASTFDGAQADADCDGVAISADGRFVAFITKATNFPAANDVQQVYRHDRKTGATVLVSCDDAGDPALADCFIFSVDVSRDGRFVTFSTTSNLVGGLSNGVTQAYRRDVKKGITELVSIAAGGGLANGGVTQARTSDDGRRIVFSTAADNLTVDANVNSDVFLRDMKQGTTTLLTTTAGGGAADDSSVGASISGNGRFVAFASGATQLVTGDSDAIDDLFVFDLKKGKRKRIVVSLPSETCACFDTRISRSGKDIAVDVRELNDVGEPADDDYHVFHARRKQGTAEPANVDSDEVLDAGGMTPSARISGDGRFITFASFSDQLGADHDGKADIFVRRVR